MKNMKVKIVNKSTNELPAFATSGSAGMDVRANLEDPEKPITIHIGKRAIIPTGLYLQVPKGYECQIRSRSGLAIKHGVACLNGVGTLDSDYTGELGVILVNHGEQMFKINHGDRIAQIVFAKHETPEFIEVEELKETERKGGFGHTGVK